MKGRATRKSASLDEKGNKSTLGGCARLMDGTGNSRASGKSGSWWHKTIRRTRLVDTTVRKPKTKKP